mgnify:FL=1
MAIAKFIDDITESWKTIKYGISQDMNQSGDNAREFHIKKLLLKTADGKKTYNIEDMILDFQYHESIESSFIRCDISILDAIDFNLQIFGGEEVEIQLSTSTAFNGEDLHTKLKVYKIGSISKTERGQLYILHCVSPEMYHDESNKVFKCFGPGEKSKDVDNVPKHICTEYLKCKGGKKVNQNNFENHSKYTFIACSWKPTDAIAFLSDKVTRLTDSKADKKQSGFLFWENRNGVNFRSIDSIAGGEATQNGVYTYTYVQGAQEGVNKYYSIESLTYPDKANHLANMRMGTYKTSAIGISLASQKDSFAPVSGSKDETSDEVDDGSITSEGGVTKGDGLSDKPGGTISDLKVLDFHAVFGKATTLEKNPPFPIPEFFDMKKAKPTRMKIRCLPGMKNQTSTGNVNNGTNPNVDTMAVAQYASARYNLFKAIKLDITIPGNSALTAGNLIKIQIPSSREEGENVELDFRFSGKYIIAGLTHIYKKTGMTTKLYLVRDSVPK